jgi:hypothetical protein
MSFISLVLPLFLIGSFVGLQQIFYNGFQSFNQVLIGDGAVSDNNQMLLIIFNNMVMSRIYCKDQYNVRCQHILKSNSYINQNMYALFISDIRVFLKNVTFLTKLQYFASYNLPVDYIVNNKTTQVTTMQFMEYYYQSLQRVQLQI